MLKVAIGIQLNLTMSLLVVGLIVVIHHRVKHLQKLDMHDDRRVKGFGNTTTSTTWD